MVVHYSVRNRTLVTRAIRVWLKHDFPAIEDRMDRGAVQCSMAKIQL